MAIMQMNYGQEVKNPLYEGNCGWAIKKGYLYSADPSIFVVEGKDSIIFYNERTKKLWLKATNARKEADKNWVELSKEKKD
ncbi:MAG: hypothetical protein ACON42_01270 [Flavobacteriaceae bacterium]